LEQFRKFYSQNSFENFEDALSFFTVFGGLNSDVYPDFHLYDSIEKVILNNYSDLYMDMINITLNDDVYHSLLTGIALGDGKIHSSLKRANIAQNVGDDAIAFLCDAGIIKREVSSVEGSDDKLIFSAPYYRFWFAFIAPLSNGIAQQKYIEVRERLDNRLEEFNNLTFEKLCMEILQESYKEDPVVEMKSYWDKEISIPIMAYTTSGKMIVAECKYTNSKLKKSELNRLSDKCFHAGVEPDVSVLFSKKGFSSELKSLKGESLRLFTVKNLKMLLVQD